MIHRIVLFEFKPETPEEEVQAIADLLRGLPAQIPQIRSYEVTPAMAGSTSQYKLGLLAGFDSLEDVAIYGPHPAHQLVLARIQAATAHIARFEYET